MIGNLKGHMIDNDVHFFSRKCPSWLQVITNIKIIGLNDQILLPLLLRDGDISRLSDTFAPKFAPQVSTHVCAKLLSRSWEFYKNGDEFGWVKINIDEWHSIHKSFPYHNFGLYSISFGVLLKIQNFTDIFILYSW